MKATILLCFMCVVGISLPLLRADTTMHASKRYAWGANTGWLDWGCDSSGTSAGILFGESYLSGFAYSANMGWINFGNGLPLNHTSYSNLGSDHGVNHDGNGNLSGYAWSANTGWINFSWTTTSSDKRPRVNLLTGDFLGYAYSANTGWINLETHLLTTVSMVSEDADADGLSDTWEWSYFGGLTTADASSDSDGDGATDLQEYAAGTNPSDASDYLKLISQVYNNGLTEVTLDFTTTSARLYRIEYSADLGNLDPWHNSSLGTFAPDSGSHTTKMVSFTGSSEQKYFFRAVALRPLTP